MAELVIPAGEVVKAVDAANEFRLENLSKSTVKLFYTDSATAPAVPTSEDAWGTLHPGQIEIRAGGVAGHVYAYCHATVTLSKFESPIPA